MDYQGPSFAGPDTTDRSARARAVRTTLPGQMLRERLETAALIFGPLYRLAEIRQRVGETLPRRVGLVRGATFVPIEAYRDAIPDEALLKYDDALRSGVFGKFLVATPTYYREQQADPWLVAEVAGATDRWAVVAQWDV